MTRKRAKTLPGTGKTSRAGADRRKSSKATAPSGRRAKGDVPKASGHLPSPPPAAERCVVVGIGAPAGGPDAFHQFLQATPPNPGLAFVLIQNLDPDHERLTADRLSRYTPMPVVQADGATPIEPDHVYMVPPNKFIELRDGALFLDTPIEDGGVRMPIDHFFRSLGEQQRELAVGIVLSGTGSDGLSDGILGLKEIKAQGGMVMGQEPATADHDDMSRSAVSAGVVDFLLPIEKMPRVLLRYVQHPYVGSGAKDRATLLEHAPDHYRSIINLLRAHTDYDFRCYKQGTLSRRIQRRMGLRHVVTLEEYLALLRESHDEINLLFKDLLINVTGFFRDKDAWAALEDQVIAPLVTRKKNTDPVRVWIPGCATGEEAYTLGIALCDQFQAQSKSLSLQMFATDIDGDAIRAAREGVYPASIASDVPPARLRKYFVEEVGQRFRINKPLRESMVFAVQDLIGDPPFSNLDIISCRNVMIYLEADIQRKMLQMFHFALAPRGHLFLGGSETTGRENQSFDVVSKPWRIYRKKGTTKRGLVNFPIVPAGDSALSVGRDCVAEQVGTGVALAKGRLLDRFVPATVLINRKYEVRYFHGNLRDYLDFPRGEPTADLIAMCLDGLRNKLRGAVRLALSQKRLVTAVAPRVQRDGTAASVVISVEPLQHRKGAELLFLVTFKDEEAPGHEDHAKAETKPLSRIHAGRDGKAKKKRKQERASVAGPQEALQQLEHEFQATREDLQGLIEELETSNEELEASSAEVLSMNEELQSTNEELESSREELQSLNEELSTVNTQLEEKIREVESTNNDLTNLLTSTNVATIFLDTDFRIRRFTPATMELLRVIPTDVGRPISDLAPRLNDHDLYRDARTVLRRLSPVEKKVCVELHDDAGDLEGSGDGRRWFIRRVRPYRTRDDRIDGVVITFTDVTTLNDALTQVAGRQRQAATVAQLGRLALNAASLEALFDEATRLVTVPLGTEFAKVLELSPDGKSLFLRSGVGWKEGLVGRATVPAGLDSQAGYTLHTNAPVIVKDLRTERRFSFPALLRDHRVVSGLSVIIGPPDAPWGVFATHSARQVAFSVDDANFVEAVANVLYEAIQRRAKEDEMRDRARQLTLVTDAMPVLIAYFDRDLVYRFCNARCKEWFGFEQDEVIGRKLPDVLGEEVFRSVRPYAEKALAGERVSFEARLPYQHGPKRHVHVEYIPHSVRTGQVVGYYAMIEDISSRVEREHMGARLASIVEYSTDAIIGKDLQGTVTSWNSAAERMYGYSAEEMVGRPLTVLLPEDRQNEVFDVIDRLRRGETVEHFETVRRARDGRELQVDLTASPIRDSTGNLIGVSAITRDISARLERERSLRESEARLQLAKRAADLGIHDFDVLTGSVQWDERTRELLGLEAGEPGTYETLLSRVHPDDLDAVRAAVAQALDPESGGYYESEYRIVRRGTREILWVESTGIVTLEDGKAVRLVGTMQDVSESRRVQQDLVEADRRKDEFLATLGHELRNPLAALVNAVECLRSNATNGDSDKLYDIMARQATHMTSLMNDLLDMSRITRSDVELRLKRLSLGEQLEQALANVQPEIEAKGHRLELIIEPADLQVVADPIRLEQIITNLLENAAKYSPDHGRITVRGHEIDDGIEIVIQDTGFGFADAEQSKRVFDLFYQARKGSGGLGIGLSLVKSLVALHGGTVEAVSEGPGQGSTLRVVLPRSLRPESAAPEEKKRVVADLGELRVLAVDDHEDSLHALRLLLAACCEVRTATSGTEGLEEARRFRPHVMLLDLALPDMSGFEIVAAARQVPELQRVRMIAMTGFGDEETNQQIAEAQFHAHMIKPLDLQELLHLLSEIVDEGAS